MFRFILASGPIMLAMALLLTPDCALRADATDDLAAVERYGAILAGDPDNGQAHYGMGSALMALDRLEEAESHFLRAGELGFRPQGVGYRIARIRARQGDMPAAVEQLQDIAKAGFGMPGLIENEADFASLQDDPLFIAALEKMRENRFPCQGREASREFDFWQGEWRVTSQGQEAGRNRIESILGGCVLFENWTNIASQSGKSFNYYDATRKHWRQIWVDDRGGVLEFTGEVRDGNMHYEAVTRDPDSGSETLHRMTFTPNEDGSVRQLMEQSTDDGESWQIAFDGHYTREGKELASAAVDQ